MPIIAAVLVVLAVFGLGRCSVDEPKPRYKVIHVQDKPVTVTKTVPGDIPSECRNAGQLLVDLQESTEELDVYAGRLNDLAVGISTFTDQPNAQKAINERKQEAIDFQKKTARISMAVLETQQRYDAAIILCDEQLNR